MVFRLEALHHGRVHRFVEKLKRITAGILRAVHRDLGLAQQVIRGGVDVPAHRDADARRDMDVLAFNAERKAECFEQSSGSGGCVVRLAHIVQKKQKLVPATTGDLAVAFASDDVRFSQAMDEPLGDVSQKCVSRTVTETLVDLFEAIDIEKEHRDGARLALALLECAAHHIEENVPVREPRHAVVIRETLALATKLAESACGRREEPEALAKHRRAGIGGPNVGGPRLEGELGELDLGHYNEGHGLAACGSQEVQVRFSRVLVQTRDDDIGRILV